MNYVVLEAWTSSSCVVKNFLGRQDMCETLELIPNYMTGIVIWINQLKNLDDYSEEQG